MKRIDDKNNKEERERKKGIGEKKIEKDEEQMKRFFRDEI
jgi:hypothetical protein